MCFASKYIQEGQIEDVRLYLENIMLVRYQCWTFVNSVILDSIKGGE